MRETITTWGGRIRGYVDTDSQGNKTLTNWGGQIKGYYDAKHDVTTTWGGRIVSQGDVLISLLDD